MQQLSVDDFHKNLHKNLQTCYCIAGVEPLQKLEAIDAVKNLAKMQDFEINAQISITANFDWQILESIFSSASLFHKKQMVHLEFDERKLEKKSLTKLLELMPSIKNNGDLILISVNKIDKETLKTKWFAELMTYGVLVQIWQIDEDKLPNWILKRSKKYSYNLTPNAAKFLASLSFGNLLAAAGELEKLAFILDKKDANVDEDFLHSIIHNSNTYNIFDLNNYLIQGNLTKVYQVLEYLKISGVEIVLVLWSFTREIRLLYAMKLALNKGANFKQVCQTNRVWRNQNFYAQILQKTQLLKLEIILSKSYQLDSDIKSVNKSEVWRNILDLSRFLLK